MLDGRKFLTSNEVMARYSIVRRTLSRWIESPTMNFPQPVSINNRLYFTLSDLDAFDQRTLAAALAKREAA